MSTRKRIRDLAPSWDMPSGPMKTVGWFLHWLLRVLVHFFWIPLIIVVLYEVYHNWTMGGALNGLGSGVTTLFIGLIVWALLYGLQVVVNIATSIQQAMTDMKRFQQQPETLFRNPYMSFSRGDSEPEERSNVVEGTITNLDEERMKRRMGE
ncbi:MAG TPA: hypothetical protein VL461_01760 [Dictyobacter sp.]|nr:hypothetical protein [Dictyobacter sp.]